MREKERRGESFGITRLQQSMAAHNKGILVGKDTNGYNNVKNVNTIIFAKNTRKRKMWNGSYSNM